jgi:hypothetical protein
MAKSAGEQAAERGRETYSSLALGFARAIGRPQSSRMSAAGEPRAQKAGVTTGAGVIVLGVLALLGVPSTQLVAIAMIA